MSEPGQLDTRTQAAIASPANQVSVSAVSVWEIAIKHALGRLTFPVDGMEDVLHRMGFDLLPIGLDHAIAAGALPPHHYDPFDRMLVAQARTENLTLVSTDQAVRRYDVALIPG